MGVVLTLEIESGDAAIMDDPGRELSQCLQKLTAEIEHLGLGQDGQMIFRDTNGNRIGLARWSAESDEPAPDCPECGSDCVNSYARNEHACQDCGHTFEAEN